SSALGFAESGFNGRDDWQSDQCGFVANGDAVASAAINAGRSRTIEKLLASTGRFSAGLHCGGCRPLGSGRLGVVDTNSARGCRDRGAIGETRELKSVRR